MDGASRPAIETNRLGRSYGRRAVAPALRDLDLTIERGELFGMLGPNGAGKTTTVKLLTTLLLPTSGSAAVAGFDVATQARRVRAEIGYVFGGDRGLYDRLSARDNMRFFADLYGVGHRIQRTRVPQLLEMVGLRDVARKKVETYSRGMKQRLHIARALVHDPQVMFMDEPSNGLDPLAARELRQLIRDLTSTGTTILLTTHYLAEADELCDRIAVMASGQMRALGTPRDLKSSAPSSVTVEGFGYGVSVNSVHAALSSIPGVTSVYIRTQDQYQKITVTMRGPDGILDTTDELSRHGVEVTDKRSASLEDAYFSIVYGGDQ